MHQQPAKNSNFVPRTKNDEFFWHEPKGECLKNHRFECEVRILLFAAESKKQGQKGPFLTSPDASKNTVFETPWQKKNNRIAQNRIYVLAPNSSPKFD